MKVKMILPALTEATSPFYRWGSIVRGASAHGSLVSGLRHAAYAAGWKKFEPPWDFVIRVKRAGMMLPVLETILSEFGKRAPRMRGGDQRGVAELVRPVPQPDQRRIRLSEGVVVHERA